MDRRNRKRWSRWLHLACGLPVEHVAIVLELDPSEVRSFLSLSPRFATAADVELWRRMRAQGATYDAIAQATGWSHTVVWEGLKRGAHKIPPPPSPPRKRPVSMVGARSARYARTLARLGYEPDKIATLLMIDKRAVADLFRRLEPVRRTELIRPRDRSEEDRMRANQAAAAAREERRRLITPPAGWSNGDRFATGEARDWARFMTALQEARASGADILGLASRVWFAPARSRSEAPPIQPAIWTGPENPHVGNPKLTREMLDEMRVLRAQGWSTGRLAKRYGVTRATICYALLGRTFRQPPPSTYPLPCSGGPSLIVTQPYEIRDFLSSYSTSDSQSDAQFQECGGSITERQSIGAEKVRKELSLPIL